MKRHAFIVFILMATSAAQGAAIDFEDLTLAPNSKFYGPTDNAVVADGPWGPELHGTFESGGAHFINRYDPAFDLWNGFAYSNQNYTELPEFADPLSFEDQYGVFTKAPNGANKFGVGFGYLDIQANMLQPFDFNPGNVEHLAQLPYIQLPAGYAVASMDVANITYTARIMAVGNPYAEKFGGATGSDPDWLLLTAYGTDAEGQPLSSFIEFYLADYRFEDDSLDYIVDDWTMVDLSPLAGASRLYFNVSSSDVDLSFGMNTPGYYAIDNIQLVPVPEPSTLAALLTGAMLLIAVGRLRRRV